MDQDPEVEAGEFVQTPRRKWNILPTTQTAGGPGRGGGRKTRTIDNVHLWKMADLQEDCGNAFQGVSDVASFGQYTCSMKSSSLAGTVIRHEDD